MFDTDDEAFEQRVGTVLKGKWTLDRLLGSGGMAAVYAATHRIGTECAIKILHPEFSQHEVLRARFEREAHAVNRFKHPGAVEIRDIDALDDGTPFMVMELLEGESLHARLERVGRMDPGAVLAIADQALDVLAAAHAAGIIHRDIKPDNLFLLAGDRLKVLDFGIARVREGSQAKALTRAGATLGTPNYMPPEQIKGVEIDHRVDLFAIGAVMFKMLTGSFIHDAKTEQELLVKMLTQPAPPLSSALPGASAELCRIVDRALAFEPEDRYPDAATMQADVRALIDGRSPLSAATGEAPHAHTRLGVAAAAITAHSAEAPPVSALGAGPAPGTRPALSLPTAGQPTPLDRARALAARYGVPPVAAIAGASLVLGVVLVLLVSQCGDDPSPASGAPAAAQPAPDAERQEELERRWNEMLREEPKRE